MNKKITMRFSNGFMIYQAVLLCIVILIRWVEYNNRMHWVNLGFVEMGPGAIFLGWMIVALIVAEGLNLIYTILWRLTLDGGEIIERRIFLPNKIININDITHIVEGSAFWSIANIYAGRKKVLRVTSACKNYDELMVRLSRKEIKHFNKRHKLAIKIWEEEIKRNV